MSAEVRGFEVVRFDGVGSARMRDVAAVEEPLEIRLDGDVLATVMRTPGADRDLVAGFLLAERIVTSADGFELRAPASCARGGCGNIVEVTLNGGGEPRATPLATHRRHITSTSSCGVCGRRSIGDLLDALPRLEARWAVPHETIAALPDGLRRAQAVFDRTGGLHAAGLFDRSGHLLCAAEDVGRHNAVDKVIGAQVLAGRVPLADYLLAVSGRASFELVQKAVVAGIPLLAAVSAPSSLAVELARRAGLTLVGFVRGPSFNVYASPERLASSESAGKQEESQAEAEA